MTEIYLLVIAAAVLIIAGIVCWLILENNRTKRKCDMLTEYIARSNREVASLCSAAVAVDTHMLSTDGMLKELVEKMADFSQQNEQASHSYHSAIQKVRAGATVDDLIHESGLTRDEASLLIRLHGQKKT